MPDQVTKYWTVCIYYSNPLEQSQAFLFPKFTCMPWLKAAMTLRIPGAHEGKKHTICIEYSGNIKNDKVELSDSHLCQCIEATYTLTKIPYSIIWYI